MAVFPDRIVLKNSIDPPEDIRAAIANDGSDPITQGEIVLSIQPDGVQAYSIDQNGNVVNIATQSIAEMDDVNITEPIANASVLRWDSASSEWINVPSVPLDASAVLLGDLFNVSVPSPGINQFLGWSVDNSQWESLSLGLDTLGDVTVNSATLASRDGLFYDTDSNRFINRPIEYADIPDRPVSLTDLALDLPLGSLEDVNITTVANNDILAYDAATSTWINVAAPPVDISGNSIGDLGDVASVGTPIENEVLMYESGVSQYVSKRIQYDTIVGRPIRVDDLETNNVNVSLFENDAGYITASEGYTFGQLSDTNFTEPIQEGHVAIYRSGEWVNEFGPPADVSYNSIGDLYDVTYFQPGVAGGILTINKLSQIKVDDPEVGSGYSFSWNYDAEYGVGMEAFRESDVSGSAVYVSRSRGITLRADVNVVRFTGRPTTTDNQPEVRFESGDQGADTPTGQYIGFKMPSVDPTKSVTYLLPDEDGAPGEVLSTNGLGVMSWVPSNAGSGVTNLNDLQDVDTVGKTNGDALVYNLSLNKWQAGSVAADLATSSINELADVDTATQSPVGGQALAWDSAQSKWVPTNVEGSIEWEITSQASTAYRLSGPGFTGTEDNPTVFLVRGQTYRFTNSMAAHPFRIQSEPGPTGATYSDGITGNPVSNGTLTWEVRMDAPSVLYYQCTSHESMAGEIRVVGGSDFLTTSSSINDLADVETVASPPSVGEVLEWNGTQWVPAPVSASFTGVDRVEETQASDASGNATFTAIGRSGVLMSVSSSVAAWVTLYATSAARTADSSRLFEDDPGPGSGVLAEVYTTSGGTVIATPGTTYFNGEATAADEIYARVRTQAGAGVVSNVTVKVFPIAIGTDTGISLQQMKAVTAASTDFADFQTRIAAL